MQSLIIIFIINYIPYFQKKYPDAGLPQIHFWDFSIFFSIFEKKIGVFAAIFRTINPYFLLFFMDNLRSNIIFCPLYLFNRKYLINVKIL